MLPNERNPSALTLPARRINAATGMAYQVERAIAVEVPISIVYGDAPYAVMMGSPGDVEDFAYGFSLTEGIIAAREDIRCIHVSPQTRGLSLQIELAPGRFRDHLSRKRAMTGRTSCGLCGIESVDQLPEAAPLTSAAPIEPRALFAALAALEERQPLNNLTRAVHGAAFCARDGAILALREDVGRHNALDKLIGARLREGACKDGFILVTSRASFEMVEKTAMFGVATLAAISAPTSLAIERAQALGLTLAAIARADGAMIFAGALATEMARAEAAI
jgi:FdhD protein